MNIHVKGGSKSQKKHIRSMVEFCVGKMMPRMGNLEFNIHIKNFGKDDSWGYCIPADYADPHRPREFDIDINKQAKLRRMLETLAHEMVHQKQNELGLLEIDSGETGSDIENEANACAGIIMRNFGEVVGNLYD